MASCPRPRAGPLGLDLPGHRLDLVPLRAEPRRDHVPVVEGAAGAQAVARARYFVVAVGARSGALRLVLDLERADGKSPAEVWDRAWRFLADIKYLTGRPGIRSVLPRFLVDRIVCEV